MGALREHIMKREAHRVKKAQNQLLNLIVRWMIRRDMPEVLRIERDSFAFNWTEDDFLACLRQRNCIGMIAESHERVLGFMIYELHRTRLHILNFAVAPECRRLGVGTQMVEKLQNKLSQQRRQEVILEVRETNLHAQLFFHKQGFRAVEILRTHYYDSNEDAYLMVHRLPLPEERPAPFMPTSRLAQFGFGYSDEEGN